ncbi:MAG TPA: hypothetical protein VJ740_06780 [Hyphomicrobiaceae bacterium]|nr:hypothetical protein [Hyphomicrobiaceae bacterium]
MKMRPSMAAALGVALMAQSLTQAEAAAYPAAFATGPAAGVVELAQFGNRAPDWRPGHGPRARDFRAWRGEPRWRGAPAWHGPRGWVGRPYWFGRPWVRRPYYGTIVAGVALGTLITVAAVGYVPRRPAPDLCWYWADPYGERGYWDYC